MTDVPVRLSDATAGRLPTDVARPGYDRARTGVGVAHLGVGAFHRVHQAAATDDAMAAEGGDWAIAGVSLRRPDMRDALKPQDGLYTIEARDDAGEDARLIGALKTVLVAREDPAAVVAAMAAPGVKVVTITVSEKGYCLDRATGALDLDHPDIAADRAFPDRPRSMVGFLTAALAARRATDAGPFTVVPCDNLPDNGARTRDAVLSLARVTDPGLADWIAEAVTFPSTMVDRIAPAATQDDRDGFAARTGVYDAGHLKTEPFTQWVIEDRFAAARPAWEAGGATFAADVAPYEAAKLRLLNGSHSAIGYLGLLAGHEFVHEAMAEPSFESFIRLMMEREAAPVTPEPPGMAFGPYMQSVRARFANAALPYRTAQIAGDGSQKIPQRLLNTIRAQLERDGPIDRLTLAVAGFMRYAAGRDDAGAPLEVNDPAADRFARITEAAGGDPQTLAQGFLSLTDVFGDLAQNARFTAAVEGAFADLVRDGAAACVRRLAGMTEGAA
ncbi:MAG: mannitol dehydrogenase family protein [Caulobacterales bacterium]|nr:mannitol dehydrogenase family protein [Caulobacterales bacterium]